MPARLRLEISCGAGGGSRTPPALCGPPRVSKRHSPARLPGTSRATRWEDLHRANGDTFGDTFRVAKQVRRCQNLGEIQANTVVTGLLSRTIQFSQPQRIPCVPPADPPEVHPKCCIHW